MENIVTYLIFQFSKKEEAQIRTWLDCGHFPNAIDRERHRIIVFNINRETMLGFVNQFHIHDWTFGQSAAQPDEYTELFRFYDSVLWENIDSSQWEMIINRFPQSVTVIRHSQRALCTMGIKHGEPDSICHEDYSDFQPKP